MSSPHSHHRVKFLWGWGMVLVISLLVSLLHHQGGLQRMEWITYDSRMKLFREDVAAHPDIAVILIDEATLQAMNPLVGRWPWPRAVYAELMEFLAMGEPRAIIFDILFSEYQREADVPPGQPGFNDESFALTTRHFGNIYHAFQILHEAEDEAGQHQLYRPVPSEFSQRFAFQTTGDHRDMEPSGNHFILPFAELYRGARGAGVVNIDADPDGIYRRTPLYFAYDDQFYLPLSLAALSHDSTLELGIGADGVTVAGETLSQQRDRFFLPNYYGSFNAFSMGGIFASYQAILHGDFASVLIDPAEFHDKYVFIGSSAIGLQDVKATPLSHNTPGVFIHASVASNVLDNDYLTTPPMAVTFVLIFVMAGVSIASILYLPRFSLQFMLPAGIIILYGMTAVWQFGNQLVLDMVSPVTSGILAWLGGFAYLTFTEGRDKRKVRRMLSQYVSPAILSEVVDKYDSIATADVGTDENLTILFSDIRSFTSISEKLQADQVVDLLNIYLKDMCDVIFEYQGTLDKFIGDAIMAFWGAPIRIENHADRGVCAAIAMHRRLAEVNLRLQEKGYPPIAIGIGLHTGNVILGNIGSEKKLDYTVIGDNVNLASRTEGLTKQYGCPVLFTENTYHALSLPVPCAQVDLVRVKGKVKPIAMYRPLAAPDDPAEILQQAHETAALAAAAFDAYLHRRWQEAIDLFEQIPEHLSITMMLERCRSYAHQEPPDSWDGVHTMETK